MTETINIVACTDKKFIMPTGVMMTSVCENNMDTDVVFHIIVDEDVNDDYRDLKDIVAAYRGKSVLFYHANDKMQKETFPKGKNRNDITRTAYYRLYLAELLPVELDKVLYLDGDVIVRHSLLPLNLKYWREHQVLKDFNLYMENHADSIRYWDQDVLNVVFCDKKVLIPLKYNFQHPFLFEKTDAYDYWKLEQEVLEAREDPCIVHFTASWKPWRIYHRGWVHPFSSTWDKYQNKSKWKGIKYDYRTKSQRIKRYAGNILRRFGLLPPLIQNSYYPPIAPTIAPID